MITRRSFFHLTGAAGASLVVPRFLTGCSNDTGSPEEGQPPLPRDPDRWWLDGNFGPVPDEIEAMDLPVEGALPPILDGVFLRNGPNPVSGASSGWFFGDGMLHGVRIAGGRALWYRNRWIRTRVYENGDSASGDLPLTANLANTALVRHAGRTLALYEGGGPYAVRPDDLSTDGAYDFAGALGSAMTAHPKVDPVSGEMVFFGYSPFPPHVTVHFVDASGSLVRSEPIDLPGPRMIHDFSLTQRHVLLYDLPVTFDLDQIAASGSPFVWKPELGARLGVMPREGSNADVRWFDIDPCYVFHSFNAYDASEEVVFEACRHDELWAKGPDDQASRPVPWRWTIDLTGGSVSEEQLDDRLVEFPRLDPRRQTRASRLGYGLRFAEAESRWDPKLPDALLKYDFTRGTTDEYVFPENEQPDEAVFAADPADEGEDAGWLLSMVFDRSLRRSEVQVFDASQVSGGPIARIAMPRRVPFGFHGDWLPTET